MITKSTKEFKTKFGIGEKVRDTWEGLYQGSEGYIDKIIIDKNGITYEVMLTEIVVHEEFDNDGMGKFAKETMCPVKIIASHFMLESTEEELDG